MKKLIITASLIIAPFIFSFAQPQPGSNSNGSTVSGGPIGGSAPLDGGIAIMLSMAAGYAAKKAMNARKKLAE